MLPYERIEKIHLWGIKFIVFLIPLLPLYVSSSLVFPYITGKNFAFRILVEFAAVLWLGLIFVNKKYRLKNSIIVLSVLMFTFIVGLADLLGVNPYNSFWSNYERMEGFVTILHLALYFVIIKSVLRTKKDWKIFFNIFVIASLLVSLYALVSSPMPSKITAYTMDFVKRPSSTIGNPPFLASYLLLSVFLGSILIINTNKTYIKYIYLFPVVLNSVVIYLTATRGVIIAAILAIIIFSLFYIFTKKQKKIEKRSIVTAVSIFIILSVVFLTFKNTDLLKNNRTISRFTVMFSDQSVKTRLNVWKMAWEGIKERPILGWGQENFIGVYTVNLIPFVEEQVWLDRAHNIIIEWLINAGFLGLFSYLSILGSALYVLWSCHKKKLITKTESIIIFTSIIAYFIQNFFTFDTINTYLILFTLLAYIDNLVSTKDAPFSETNINSKKPKIIFFSITLLALFFVAFVSYFLNYKPIKEAQLSRKLTQISIKSDSSFLPLLNVFKKALSYKTFGDSDIRMQMAKLSHAIMRYRLFENEGALKFIQETADELEKFKRANRYNLEYLSFLIIFYQKIAFFESSFITKVDSLIKEGVRINPEYEFLYFLLAENSGIKKDYNNAFIILKERAILDPENDMIQMKLALAAIRNSREDVVERALDNVKKLRAAKNDETALGKEHTFSVRENSLIAKAYLEIKNYKKALHYFKEKIRLEPGRADFHFQTVEIYLALGDKENAIKEAKKSAELDPLNYTEISNKFIQSIKNININ